MVKRLLKIMNIIILVFFAVLLVFIINGSVEYNVVQKEIKEFKQRAEIDFTFEEISTTFFKVNPKYDYEDASRETLTYGEYLDFIGSAGDIIITNRNPAKDIPILNL